MAKARSINSKKHHGGRVKGFGPADGNAPASSDLQPTPAPTRKVAPDMISRPRQPSPGLIGSRLSNIPAGTQALTPMAEVLKQDGDDGTLDKIVSGETTGDDQLRTLTPGNVPDHPGMKRQTSDNFGSLPTKLG
jgi:hypothetical protein